MMYGKNAKLPGRLVFYFIRAPENYILEEAYKPMGYRRGTRLLYYPWVECIHGLCHGAMRFNYMADHPRKCQCEAGESGVVDPQDCSPEVLYQLYRSASERGRGILFKGMSETVVTVTSVQDAQMALTRASISSCSGNVEIPTDSPQRMLAENNREESLEMNMRAPTCASKVEVDLSSCNTCCCKQGLATTRIGHNLIQGSVRDCGTWFGFNDAIVRSFVTLFRSGWAVDKFGMKCFPNF